MPVVVGMRLRGMLAQRKLDRCGGDIRVGRGVNFRRAARPGWLEIGHGVVLFAGVLLSLEYPEAVIEIGALTYVAQRTQLIARECIKIGRDCAISWDVCIMDTDFHKLVGSQTTAPVTIGDHVWIGARATILKGVRVGDGAVIAAGALVERDVPPHSLVAGVPARPVRPDVSWEH
jgi:tetrahydrodipicolinate N-succinyltransferase